MRGARCIPCSCPRLRVVRLAFTALRTPGEGEGSPILPKPQGESLTGTTILRRGGSDTASSPAGLPSVRRVREERSCRRRRLSTSQVSIATFRQEKARLATAQQDGSIKQQ